MSHELVCQIGEDENEHALKWVINSIDCLCGEYVALGRNNDDAKEQIHLELSTIKILDELQMPAIEHAKREVLLLTRLHESLSQLVSHREKVLGSSDAVTARLKWFRKEIQQLFPQSAKKLGVERKIKEFYIEPLAPVAGADEEEESAKRAAERTKTPSDEAVRPGHEQDRSDRVTDMSESGLRKLNQEFVKPTNNPKGETESAASDTNAAGSRSRGANVGETDDRSQRIWFDEDLTALPPAPAVSAQGQFKPPSIIASSRRKRGNHKSADTNAIATTVPTANAGEGGEDERENFAIREQSPPVRPSRTQEQAASARSRADVVVREESQVHPPYRKIAHGVAVLSLPILLLWTALLVHEWNRQCSNSGRKPFSFVFLVICGVVNAFCENYDTFCTSYCASGLQREYWQCRR